MMFPAVSVAEVHTFHNTAGKALTASFEGVRGERVVLKRSDGKSFEIPLASLSAADQQYIQDQSAKAEQAAGAVNRAAGRKLSNGQALAARKAEELAADLQLRSESKTKFGASWRLYAAFAKDYRLFGAMPYSAALYAGEDGLVTGISLVYANKGDFGSQAGFGQDHFNGGNSATAKTLGEAMERDAGEVSKALTDALGPGKPQRYGEGETRRKITRWDWNGHAFLLSLVEGEYVSLQIVPTETADAGGKSLKVRDSDVKERLLKSVVREGNGDVYLSEIPMVDQGPKGYCVPATFERAMRTMGLEADMYLLAMVGQSRAGGGTSVELLLENVRSQVYRKGRRTKDDNLKELRIRDIKKYLDQGVPVMWTMHSVDAYNDAANENTRKRKSVTDWKTYATEIDAAAGEIAAKSKPDGNNHICMIIGYNEATQEIAVSDSWGAQFECRWVPVKVADWVSMGGIFLILP